jgi:hypothetical protein
LEQKWEDALNVAAAEPVNWEAARTKPEKPTVEKQAGGPMKA